MKIVLIDNDLLIRKSWEFAANKCATPFESFSCVDDFLSSEASQNTNTIIYIDYELDDDVLGTNAAKVLFERGFTNITLATGHSSDEITLPDFFEGIVGKRPPF